VKRGDRFHNSPKWTAPQAQHMPSAAGFETVSLDEGRQILAVAEKVAAQKRAGVDRAPRA